MEEPNRCRMCGQTRPAGAPGELCPVCRLQSGAGQGPMAEGAHDRQDKLVTLGPASSSVLATLARTLDRVPHVVLRGSEPGFGPPSPSGIPVPADHDRALRLRLFDVIGHGGMGVVLKGYDADLGRDLAVKVLREQFGDQPDMVRRFIEEAQIGGQLQHPGIVPVYELGSLSDRRPYIAMKLIRGRTLAELLTGRRQQDDDWTRLLGIFESACQTMAYAHDRGVIHRDLKPSNIMVGSFGEVQVVDWGLAKVLIRVDAAGGEGAGCPRRVAGGHGAERGRPRTVAAGECAGDSSLYGAEQARGEVESLDERADVFALGSILCEILTRAPAFVGASPEEIELRAALGEVADGARPARCLRGRRRADRAGKGVPGRRGVRAAARRPGCGGKDHRLPRGRARTAPGRRARQGRGSGAAEEEAKRSGLADQLAAEAQAHAVEERRRRRLTMALAASILALVVCGGGASTWFVYQRQAGLARVDLALQEAKLLADQAEGDPEGDVARWNTAQVALRHARVLLDAVPATLVRTRLGALEERIVAGTAAAEADRTLVARLEEIRRGLDADLSADRAYGEAFRAAGLDPTAPEADPAAIGSRLAGRPQAVTRAAASALDAWAIIRRSLTRRGDADGQAACRRLLHRGGRPPIPTPGAAGSAPPSLATTWRRSSGWPRAPSWSIKGPSASGCSAKAWQSSAIARRPWRSSSLPDEPIPTISGSTWSSA